MRMVHCKRHDQFYGETQTCIYCEGMRIDATNAKTVSGYKTISPNVPFPSNLNSPPGDTSWLTPHITFASLDFLTFDSLCTGSYRLSSSGTTNLYCLMGAKLYLDLLLDGSSSYAQYWDQQDASRVQAGHLAVYCKTVDVYTDFYFSNDDRCIPEDEVWVFSTFINTKDLDAYKGQQHLLVYLASDPALQIGRRV